MTSNIIHYFKYIDVLADPPDEYGDYWSIAFSPVSGWNQQYFSALDITKNRTGYLRVAAFRMEREDKKWSCPSSRPIVDFYEDFNRMEFMYDF